MGIYIKGLKAPKSCIKCRMGRWSNYYQKYMCEKCDKPVATYASQYKTAKPDWCPIIEIPEPYGEHLCEDEVVSCLEGADWINEVIRIFMDLQAEGSEDA